VFVLSLLSVAITSARRFVARHVGAFTRSQASSPATAASLLDLTVHDAFDFGVHAAVAFTCGRHLRQRTSEKLTRFDYVIFVRHRVFALS